MGSVEGRTGMGLIVGIGLRVYGTVRNPVNVQRRHQLLASSMFFLHDIPMIRTFQGIKPEIPDTAFIEETAVIIGDVVMGEDSSAWFHAVVRGDVHYIRIGHRTNIQDLSMLHVTHDTHPILIGDDVTVGHHVVLHGCTIQHRVLVGMGAIIMDGAIIGEDCVIGAGALVTERMVIPPNSLVLGSPAKVKRSITDKELAWIKESANNYVHYAKQYMTDPEKPKTGFRP